MHSRMWFIRLLFVSMIFSHLSHEKYSWSALCIKNHLGKVECWTRTCLPHWGQRHQILEAALKMHTVWQMIPLKLSLEEAYDWPPWRETTSVLIWTTICFSSKMRFCMSFILKGFICFYYFYRTQVSLGSDLWVLMSVRHRSFADLTDVTLADKDSNSIQLIMSIGQS